MLFIFSHQAAEDWPFFSNEEHHSEISRFEGTRFFTYMLMYSTPYPQKFSSELQMTWMPFSLHSRF